MRWRYRRSTGLMIFPVLLLALAPGSAADIAIDAKVRRIVAADLAPETKGKAGGLAVAVYVAGHTQFFNYGFADESTRRPVTSDTLFNLASMRKPFEAILVALGTLRGELSLDDPVSRYVPELRGDAIKSVTIGELATHTSGLLLPTDHPPWPTDSFDLQQFFKLLNAWTPPSGEQPGKQRIYTHAGYVLLQLALERRYGRPIAELIDDRILKPLGMNQTFLPERGPDQRAIMAPELLKRAVQGYAVTGIAAGPVGDQQSYYDFPGTGQMFSSAHDLATFVAACIDGAAIDPQLRQALQLTQRERFRVTAKFGQAMAWENVHLDDVDVVDKPAGLNNATAYVGLVPAHRVGIVLLANSGDFAHEIARYRVLPELARGE
jgi:beta-lactamase class C